MDHDAASMRTPLGKVRGLGSARSGTEHFWMQRLTGMANVPLAIAFVAIVVLASGADHAAAVKLIGHPLATIPLLLFTLSGAYHMRLGLQVVIEDYIHWEGPKLLALMANTFFSIGVGLAAAWAILKISFGG